jgi:cholera toxin transcriptional activator
VLNCHLNSMATSQPTAGSRIIRFGVFEADLAAGELRKKGLKIRLQEQPFQVLAALLVHPGEAVTREQLRERIWPSDTFVDFDHSLNTAINKIRDALGDSAANPRFVETLARRGYRFIAPVQPADDLDIAKSIPASPLVNPGSTHTADQVEPGRVHPELEVPIPRREITRTLFALIQAMYLTFYVLALWRWERIDEIAGSFLPSGMASLVALTALVSALIGIPLRLYLLTAVLFDHRRLGENFRRMFLFILPLDQLWAMIPFLLTNQIGVGPAFAATAALLYLPFSERTLVRLAYADATATRR